MGSHQTDKSVAEQPEGEGPAGEQSDAPPYTSLPDRIRPEDVSATQQAHPVPDPTIGRDAENDFMLRYSG